MVCQKNLDKCFKFVFMLGTPWHIEVLRGNEDGSFRCLVRLLLLCVRILAVSS